MCPFQLIWILFLFVCVCVCVCVCVQCFVRKPTFEALFINNYGIILWSFCKTKKFTPVEGREEFK